MQRLATTAILLWQALNLAASAHAETYKLQATWSNPPNLPGQFATLDAVAVDSAGRVLVLDGGNGRIQRFHADGGFLDQWPIAAEQICADGNGFLYVLPYDRTPMRYDETGQPDPTWTAPAGGFARTMAVNSQGELHVVTEYPQIFQSGPSVVIYDAQGAIASQWGDYGSAMGQFMDPSSIAAGPSGDVYVLDRARMDVEILDSEGTFLGQLLEPDGTAAQFGYGASLAVDAAGAVYVYDDESYQIRRFACDGSFLDEWGGPGTGPGQFSRVSALAVDALGNIYAADTLNRWMQKFDSDGIFAAQWGFVLPGQFRNPASIATDAAGNVYLPDGWSRRLWVFDAGGALLESWGNGGVGDAAPLQADDVAWSADESVLLLQNDHIRRFSSTGVLLNEWGEEGTGDGQFQRAVSLAADLTGNVYVADADNNRVQKFTGAGDFQLAWGEPGTDEGQFFELTSVCAGQDDYVYTSDYWTQRVQKYAADGQFVMSWQGDEIADFPVGLLTALACDGNGHVYALGRGEFDVEPGVHKFTDDGELLAAWGGFGHQPDRFAKPQAIAVDSMARVLVADTYNDRIQVFALAGDFTADGRVGEEDLSPFLCCMTGPDGAASDDCFSADFDGNETVDLIDVGRFLMDYRVAPE